MTEQTRLFRAGSKTYFNSTRFFPPEVRGDVFVLYGFVRKADNFVDSVPQQPAEFAAFCNAYHRALEGTASGDPVIDDFIELARRATFDPAWTEAFLSSMEMDLTKRVHATLEESLHYIYGSAEVIGLFMARVMGLEEAAFPSAQMLGRAMQYINFIRDIDEDNGFGRIYLPISETALASLTPEAAHGDPDEFRRFIHAQLDRYDGWQREAAKGYRFMPKRFRIPVKTAMDMYHWTGTVIRRDPFVVFRRKVKPRRARIFAQAACNALTIRQREAVHA